MEIAFLIADAFAEHGDKLEDLKEIYTDLKKSDNWQSKIEISVPLLNLVGINIKTEVKLNKILKWIHNTF